MYEYEYVNCEYNMALDVLIFLLSYAEKCTPHVDMQLASLIDVISCMLNYTECFLVLVLFCYYMGYDLVLICYCHKLA